MECLRGWCQSSMAGANIQWPEDFGLNVTTGGFRNNPTTGDVLKFSWLLAAPFITGALVAFFITDPLVNEWGGGIGRKWAIIITGIFSLVSVVAAAFAESWQTFMAWRILLGVGWGTKASIAPIYISEICEYLPTLRFYSTRTYLKKLQKKIRGMLAMSWQVFDTLGILLGNCANLAVFRLNPDHPNWRFMIALPFIPSLMFLTLVIFCVESPRWLLKAGKVTQALQALIRLHDLPSPIVACGELYLLFRQLEEEERIYGKELKLTEQTSKLGRLLRGTRNAYEPNPDEQKLLKSSWLDRVRLLLLVRRMRKCVTSIDTAACPIDCA